MDSNDFIAIGTELKRIWKLQNMFGPKLGGTAFNTFLDLKGGRPQDEQ